MGLALPKCNMGRDSCPNFCYKKGLEVVRGPVHRWFGVQVGIRKQLTDTGVGLGTQGSVRGGSRYR
jgi:hypothetical protein